MEDPDVCDYYDKFNKHYDVHYNPEEDKELRDMKREGEEEREALRKQKEKGSGETLLRNRSQILC
jgi:hypothetical protein